jgi:hypothetical protein
MLVFKIVYKDPPVAFYDIPVRKGAVPFYSSVPNTIWDNATRGKTTKGPTDEQNSHMRYTGIRQPLPYHLE